MKVVFSRQTWMLLSLCYSLQISAAVVPTALPLPDSYQPASSLLIPAWLERAAISGKTPVTTAFTNSATTSSLKSLTNAEKYLALRSLKRKSADLDRDGLADSQDPDDDNDGIADTEDAFPRLANEWLDTDGDGIGNNADADDDNDGVPDDLDALPLDATENKDSDGDGKGDNSDAYPNDAACDKTSNGNGQICYLTMLKDVANDDIHLDKQGLLHILARKQQQIFRLNPSSGDFLPAVTFRTPVDNPKLINIRYAPELDKVFVVVDNKAIYAYQPEAGVLDLLMAFDYLDPVLETTGRYLLIHTYPGYQILDPVRKRLSECDSYSSFGNMRWEPVQQRLYYETSGMSRNNVLSFVINQQARQCETKVEMPYHGDFDIEGPIRLSADGQQMLLGTGDLFSTANFNWQGRLSATGWQDAVIRDGQIWLVKNGTLEIFDNEHKAIAYLAKAGHHAFGLRDMSDQLLVLSRKPQQLSWYFHRSSDQPDDSDGDGVANLLDAFPADPAAAVDTDFDGAPDRWLPGKTAANSNSGLQLDAFPTESLCFATAHDVNGHCDRERLMPLFEPDQTAYDNEGTLYLFHREHRFIYRWSAATGKFLNPIPVAQLQLQPGGSVGVRLELPASFLLDAANQQIYLHYQRGDLTRLSLLDGKEQPFMRYPLATKPLLAGPYLLLQRYDEKGFYNQFDIFNHQGQLLSSALRQNAATAVLHDAVQHKLWITDLDTTANTIDPTDSLIRWADFSLDGVVGSVTMAFLDQYPWSSVDLGNQLSLSPQGQITTGNGWFINNTQPPSLDRSKRHLVLDYQPDAQHYWFDATLVQVGYDARIFSSESYQQLHQIDLQLPMSSAVRFPYQHDLVELRQLDGRYQATYHWISDRDGDGMPGWWEQKYGLNNDDPLDATTDLDQDGLNNLEEFNAGADPTALDGDGDGLSDFDEVRQYRTHPGKLDSDLDTITDGDEVNFGMDPTADDRFSDVDQDGHYNLEEIEFGSSVNNVDSVPEAPGWLTAQGDNQRRAYVPLVLQPENFSFKWQFTTPQRMVGLAVHEQQLALTTVAANNAAASLQLRNTDNGTVNWQQSFSNSGNTATSSMISAPAIDTVGRVFLNANDVVQSTLYDMHSYDLQNGQLLWRNTSAVPQNYSSQAPLMQDNTLYLAGSNFKAFDANDGAMQWSTLYLTGSWSAAVAGEQLLFVAADDGANCRPFRWVVPSDGNSYTDWTCTEKQRNDIAANTMPIYPQWGSDNRALLTVGDGVVSKSLTPFYKRDWFKTDQISSGLDAKKQIHSSLAPGLVFMVRQNRLWQLDSETGAEHWQWTPPAGKTLIRAVVATSSHVFVSSQDTTYAVDRKTQTMVWSYPKSGKLAVDKQQLLLIQGEKELTAITLGQ